MLAAFPRLDHAAPARLADEGEAHIRQRGQAVLTRLLLHLGDDVLQRIELVLVERQRLADQLIALDQLGRGEAERNPRALGVVLDEMRDAVDAAVQGAAVRSAARRAEVQPTRALPMARDVQRVLDQLAGALVLRRRDGDDRDSQQALEEVDVDGPAVRGDLVHHVQRQHHGPVELHELHREIEVALDIRGVDDVDDRIGASREDEVAAHHLLARVGRQRVDAGKVGDGRLGMAADHAVLAVHRDAGKVAHMLVRARELVEQGGLAAVLVAGEREGDRVARGDGMLAGTGPVGLLAQRGMRRLPDLRVHAIVRMGLVDIRQRDARGVGAAQGQLVAAQADLEGVAHGGVLHHRHLGAGREAHVEDVLAQRGVIGIDRRHDGVLADLELIEPKRPCARLVAPGRRARGRIARAAVPCAPIDPAHPVAAGRPARRAVALGDERRIGRRRLPLHVSAPTSSSPLLAHPNPLVMKASI